ncbi:hypothetical protein BH09PSE2_BH09PSE2_03660 [soil metagenome]
MSDPHDLHVLNDLAAAVRATPGAPAEAAGELEAFTGHGGEPQPDGRSILDTAREALGGLLGGGHPAENTGGEAERLAALLTRFDAALHDGRLSGPARDAVLRAFDPVKDARDAALQRQSD